MNQFNNPFESHTVDDVMRHLAAEAALRALPQFDEDLIPFETHADTARAGFIGLAIARASLTAVVRNRFQDAVAHEKVLSAAKYLRLVEDGPCKSILERALDAQTHKNPILLLERILDEFGEFSLGDMVDLAGKRNDNLPEPRPDFFDGPERNFVLPDIHSTSEAFFWQELAEASGLHAPWRFWRDWYAAFYSHSPLDWELQRRVALIADDIWDSGPEAVAEKIREIEAKWALEREISSLKEQLEEAKQINALPSRLHNQPPEAIDDTQTAFRTDVSLIWNKLEELEEEVQKPAPSPSKLLQIAAWISDKAVSLAKYCGSVADDMLRAGGKAYAIAAGTAAGSATVAAVSLPDGMKTVVELIEKFVAVIG